jgi:hypothetical protein
MLELRPICEHCAKALPPESLEAMICSFECTFCRTCVDEVIANVCPSCGGGFCPRPVRPARDWNRGLSTAKYPPGNQPLHRPVDAERHGVFSGLLRGVAAAER